MHERHFWKHLHDIKHEFGGRGGPFGGGGGRRGGRGGWFGFGGGGPGGFGPGGFDVTRGRKLSSAELQLVLLALIDEKSRHGYDLIKALDEKSGGFYVPSPGVIYPALTYLEEAEQVVAEAQGSRKLYSLTDNGREQLTKRRAEADEILGRLAAIGERMSRVREAFTDDGESDFPPGPPGPPGPFGPPGPPGPPGRFGGMPRGPWAAHADLGAAIADFHVAMKHAKRLSPEAITEIIAIIRRAAGAIRDVAEQDRE